MKLPRCLMGYAGCVLLLLSAVGAAYAQTISTTDYKQFVRSTTLSVFGDGSTEVNQTLILPDNLTSVNLPLFANDVGNVLAINQGGSPVSYVIGGGNLTLYTFGATRVSLAYDTGALTTKQGTIWDVKFSYPLNVSLTLPFRSTILSFSDQPTSISTVNGSPVLTLGAGSWEVSYGVPITTATSTATTTTTSTTAESGFGTATPASLTSPLAISAMTGSLATAVAIFLLLRRTGRLTGGGGGGVSAALRFDDREILRFVKEKGGKAVESEIRERFSLPRTSAWRQAKRLEKLGFIKISKLGTQNEVELLRVDFEQGSSE